jgi:uncharacterized protein
MNERNGVCKWDQRRATQHMHNHHHSSRQWVDFIIPVLCLLILLSGCTRIAQPALATEVSPADLQLPTQDQTKAIDPTITDIPTHSQGPAISEIQGAGHVSPIQDQEVSNVHGIVTVIRADGFYLQSTIPDENSATSEGIYVFQGLVPSVRPGDEVLVSGVVKERVTDGDAVNDLTITQIRFPEIEVLSRGNPLPTPIVIGEGGQMPPTDIIDDSTQGRVMAGGGFDPENAGLDFYESLEGMLVRVNNAVVVGATNRYKEIVVLPDGGSWAGVRTPRGGIVVREGDFNPERVILDDALLELPFVQVGDTATGSIVGVMDYTYGNYKLQPIEEVTFASMDLQTSDPLMPVEPGQIRVASYNVAVLSAREPNRLAALAEQIVNGMASPEIIGLQEVADNDGIAGTLAISADETYQGLIEAIARFGGPPYAYVDIDPLPGQDGGVPDANIRVGFLYRLDRGLILADAPHGDAETAVSVVDQGGVPMLSLNPGRIDPTNRAFTSSRKPLAVMFFFNGQPLYVINNHFNSKGGDHSLFGAVQPPILSSEVQRIQQAQIVHDFVASILAINPESRVIVMGDLNDFHFSRRWRC